VSLLFKVLIALTIEDTRDRTVTRWRGRGDQVPCPGPGARPAPVGPFGLTLAELPSKEQNIVSDDMYDEDWSAAHQLSWDAIEGEETRDWQPFPGLRTGADAHQ
jgi:hypothetical protein